jgi:hypothetical protein
MAHIKASTGESSISANIIAYPVETVPIEPSSSATAGSDENPGSGVGDRGGWRIGY